MNFSKALKKLKNGATMTRGSWATRGASVWCEASTAIRPYFLIDFGDGQPHSFWVPSIGDLFAKDWEEVV